MQIVISVENKRSASLRRAGELKLAYSGRALAPLPHPPRARTKTKAACLRLGRSGF